MTEAKSNKEKIKNITQNSLKKMRKKSERNYIRDKGRIIKYGASGFTRNIWLSTAATAVMAITLIILFATIVASAILNNTAEIMREKIDITIYLKPNVSEKVLDELSDTIKIDPNIKSVVTSTSKDEYKKLVEEKADDETIMELINDKTLELSDFLVAGLPSIMRIKVYNVDDLTSIKELVANNEQFKKYINPDKSPTYEANQAEIATITKWANIARIGGVILGIVFLIISILIIFSTIRMAIFSRREEIYMMKLVGAEKDFIRGPFLIEAEICGIISGIIAATLSFICFQFLSPKLSNYGVDVEVIKEILESNKLVLMYFAFIIAGMIIGRISARLAVSKYLKKF